MSDSSSPTPPTTLFGAAGASGGDLKTKLINAVSPDHLQSTLDMLKNTFSNPEVASKLVEKLGTAAENISTKVAQEQQLLNSPSPPPPSV